MDENNGGSQRRIPRPPDLLGLGRKLLSRPSGQADLHTEIESSIADCALYVDGERHDVPNIDAALSQAREKPNSFLWLGLHEPSPDELIAMAQRFELHPLAVEDAIHAHQRPKLEVFGDTSFVILKPARYVDPKEVIQIGETMLFVNPNFLVSVRYGLAAELHGARASLEQHPEILRLGVMAAFWAIADRVVDGYEEALAGVATDIDEIEASVFDPKTKTSTERVYKLKREMLEFRRVVEPLEDALAPLLNGQTPLARLEIIPYLRDVDDHLKRASSRLLSFDQLLSDVLQANLAITTLQQNIDMRRITSWAAILAVNTTVAGIYGMNFKNMPELNWHYGYYECLGLMVVLSALLYVVFKRKDWL